MRKIFFKTSIVIFCLAVCSGFMAAQKVVQGYKGEPRKADEVVTVRYDENKLAIRFWIFKVDGKLTSDNNSLLYTYNSAPRGAINLQLLPGEHELEIQRAVSDKVQVLAFTGEAGKEYLLISEKDILRIEEKTGKETNIINFTIRDIPFYSEVPDSVPHALLVEEGKSKGKDSKGVTALLRIDGMPGKNLMTGWVAHYMFNSRLKFDYSVRLTPGEHTLDFYGYIGQTFNKFPMTRKYNLEAGKKYTITYELKKDNDVEFLEPSIIEVK